MKSPAQKWLMAVMILLLAGALVMNPAPTTRERQAIAPSPARHTEPPLPHASKARVSLASREFLDGYLPYLHGRVSARSIGAATRSLRTRLAARPAIVSPALRARAPRVVSITPAGALAVTATVNDGELASYQLTLHLTDQAGRLLVASVEGAQ